MHSSRDRLTVFQAPNLPLIVAVLSSVLCVIGFLWLPAGRLFGLVAFGSWFTWGWLELFQGVNWLRRGLGIVCLGALLVVGMYVLGA